MIAARTTLRLHKRFWSGRPGVMLAGAAGVIFSRTVTATFPNRVYKASTIARDQAIACFDSIGKNHELFSPVGTDAFSFNTVGITPVAC